MQTISNKLRDAFHNELTATAEELSKAMAFYASRGDAALASFMEKATARRRGSRRGGGEAEPVLRSSGKRRSIERR